MRHFLNKYLIVFFSVAFFAMPVLAQSGGTGTAEDPYLIGTPEDLHWMAQADSGSYFKFIADIDMKGDSSWVPLVSKGKNLFWGHIDGDYHVIKNLYIKGTSDKTAFIKAMGNPSSVVRLGFDSLTVEAPNNNQVAGIAGECFNPNRTISECFITNGKINGGNTVGGLAGFCWSYRNNIRDNYFDGIVSGKERVGGLFPRSKLVSTEPGGIGNCLFYGKIYYTGTHGPISADLVSSDSTWGPDMYYVNYVANDEGNFTGNATELDSTDLTNPANYPTLDFDNTWVMGEKYPILRGFFGPPSRLPEPKSNVVHDFLLEQNYPNPFNPGTVISFYLPESRKVSLEIFNNLGQLIKILLNNEILNSGRHSVYFNAQNLPNGIYYYRLTAGKFQQVKKMVLIK